MPTNSKHPETVVLHSGYRSDPATNAVAVPIYQTTSYQFRDTEHAANLFALAEVGNVYTRIMNPTQAVLEGRINSLEGGCTTAIGIPGTLVVSSGQSAEVLAILTLAETGPGRGRCHTPAASADPRNAPVRIAGRPARRVPCPRTGGSRSTKWGRGELIAGRKPLE